MQRRRLLLALGGFGLGPILALSARHVRAQAKRRIAIMLPGKRDDADAEPRAFVAEMQRLGWSEARNVSYESFYVGGSRRAIDAVATALAQRKPELVVALNSASARAVTEALPATPLIFIAGADPVAGGLVRSLREPGRNATGVFQMVADALGKRLELAHEVFPQSRRIGVLFDHEAQDYALQKREHGAIALPKGVSLAPVELQSFDKLREALNGIKKEGAMAFLTVPSFPTLAHRKELVAAALELRLAPIGHRSEFADSGALFSFGADAFELQRRAADLANRVLRGAKPETTPVERATKFELVFNLRTARELGIQVPKNVLLRADRVIQ